MTARFIAFLSILALGGASPAQRQQNPSPMAEHTREHPRIEKSSPPGRREKLIVGTLFIPARLQGRRHLPLFVHFHGDQWLPEVVAARDGHFAVISVQTGDGSSIYAQQFSDRTLFDHMLREASKKSGVTFDSIALTAWSAGHGAIREILQVPAYYSRVHSVLLIDGFHTGVALILDISP